MKKKKKKERKLKKRLMREDLQKEKCDTIDKRDKTVSIECKFAQICHIFCHAT